MEFISKCRILDIDNKKKKKHHSFSTRVYPSSFKNLLVKSRKRKNMNFLKKTSFFLSKTIEFN